MRAIKSNSYLLILIAVVFLRCTDHKQQKGLDRNAPKVVVAEGFDVPQNSIVPPQVIKVEGLTGVPAGKPTVVQLQSYITPAGEPSVTDMGTPTTINTPGKGPYKLPEIIPVMDSSFVVGLPEVVEVKSPKMIDYGHTSYSTYSTLQGLKGSIILNMYADRVGNIWAGTWGNGIAKYDGRSFTQYTTAQGLNSDAVGAFLEDSNGNFWFGTYQGVCKFDGKYLTTFPKIPELSQVKINTLLEEKNGNIWMGTLNALLKYSGKTVTKYTTDQGLNNNAIWGLREDEEGNIWIEFPDGYSKYDGQSFSNYAKKVPFWSIGTQQRIRKYSFSNTGLYKNDGVNHTHLGLINGLNGSGIYASIEDQSSNLWIGSNGGGIAKSNGQLFTSIRVAEGLSRESIRSIMADRSGNIWIGTWGGGVNKYDGQSISHFTTVQGLCANAITAMCEDKDGNLWFGSRTNGLDKFDGKAFTHYSQDQGLFVSGINCMTVDREGNIWIGTEEGASKYDGISFTNYRTAQGLSGSRVFSILQDKNNNIWFGTVENGLTKYDGKSFTHFNTASGLNDATVQAMLEDKKGNLWFGTANGGVNKYDGKTFTQYTVDQGLVNNNVNSILEDASGNIWFGTSNGLSMMSKASENKSTSGFNKDNHAGEVIFKNYSYADGFLGVGTWYNSLVQDKNGIIWAGATDRITAYHKEEDKPDTIPPHIQLSGISLFNEDIDWLKVEKDRDTILYLQNGATIKDFKFSTVSKWSYTPEQLALSYNNNSITFKFIGITSNKPDRVKYQYMLEGLDQGWSAPTGYPEATYTNLFHGSYTFRVKAMNSEGYWSKELQYPFLINPPWWFSWWAYGVYAFIFIGGVRIIHLYQKQRVIRVEQEKAQKKELQHAKEIEKAYNHLKSTQAQLIQSEKMASLGELTAGIAHEIQNPLNFVNNFSEVSNELIKEVQDIRHKTKDQNVNAEEDEILNDIAQNLEKINHHGKRAADIVKGMLQHSRSSSGQREPTDINALCDEYLRLSYHGLRAKDKSFNAKFETDFDTSLSKLNVIPQDIGRVILNLINNAFYAVNERANNQQRTANIDSYEPMVSVSTKKLGDKIEISVKDNGNGIPDSIKEKIFQPFFTTKPTGQGTGLGLSLSYDIVKAHGGELSVRTPSEKVETKEGEGSIFTIQIPMA